MSLGLQLILSTTLVATPPGCSWAHPGANPYRGDPVAALSDFGLSDEQRAQIATQMRARQPTDVVTITRDDILSRSGPEAYTDLREMHSGGGQVCHGEVDRSAWPARRRERALVYCAGDACVIVPTICNNVSRVSRKPDRAAVLDETPIDIEPAAGPGPAPSPTDTSQPPQAPLAFFPNPEDGGLPSPSDAPPSGGGGASPPGDGGGAGSVPIGGPPCCATGPSGPGPVTPPATPPPPVPEPPNALLLLAGLAVAGWRARVLARA